MNSPYKITLLATLLGLAPALLGACSPVPMATRTPPATVTLTRPGDGALMVYVPAGEFLAGATDADGKAADDEMPQHTVYLDAFWIDKTEVTNVQYAQFLNALGSHVDTCGEHQCVEMKEGEDADSHILQRDGRYEVERGFEEHPVIEVTWYGAQAYCQWAGVRLPTEAEWEKAARGVDGRIYPWGNDAPDCSREQYGDCGGATVPVGSKSAGASPYGALDMAGNVWEWVADWYDVSYYLSSPADNPQGPTWGEDKVFRGGSWGYLPQFTRTTDRGRNSPSYAGLNIGFRCAQQASASMGQGHNDPKSLYPPVASHSSPWGIHHGARIGRSIAASVQEPDNNLRLAPNPALCLWPPNVLEWSKIPRCVPDSLPCLEIAARTSRRLGAETLDS